MTHSKSKLWIKIGVFITRGVNIEFDCYKIKIRQEKKTRWCVRYLILKFINTQSHNIIMKDYHVKSFWLLQAMMIIII